MIHNCRSHFFNLDVSIAFIESLIEGKSKCVEHALFSYLCQYLYLGLKQIQCFIYFFASTLDQDLESNLETLIFIKKNSLYQDPRNKYKSEKKDNSHVVTTMNYVLASFSSWSKQLVKLYVVITRIKGAPIHITSFQR